MSKVYSIVNNIDILDMPRYLDHGYQVLLLVEFRSNYSQMSSHLEIEIYQTITKKLGQNNSDAVAEIVIEFKKPYSELFHQ